MAQEKEFTQHEENWITEYQAKRPLYERLCVKLRSLLEDVLLSEGISYHVVESRAKTLASLAEKLQRDGKSYTNPLIEITDFAGLRVILYYVGDVERVNNIIENEFIVDKPRSVDKRTTLAPDQFGYLSVHKIVRVSEARSKLPEWAGLGSLAAEIQIRTVLQHSWAAISHALQYKREADIPYQFRRRLMRLSGLLELADEEFGALRTQQIDVKRDIAEKVSEGNLDIPIDAISVSEFIDGSEIVQHLKHIVEKAGYRIRKVEPPSISRLTQVCQILGIKSIEQLEMDLVSTSSNAQAFWQELMRIEREDDPNISSFQVSGAHIVSVILFALYQVNPVQGEENSPWSPRYTIQILKASSKLNKKK